MIYTNGFTPDILKPSLLMVPLKQGIWYVIWLYLLLFIIKGSSKTSILLGFTVSLIIFSWLSSIYSTEKKLYGKFIFHHNISDWMLEIDVKTHIYPRQS